MQSVLLLVLHGALRRRTGTIYLLNSEYSADIQSKVLKGKSNAIESMARVLQE